MIRGKGDQRLWVPASLGTHLCGSSRAEIWGPEALGTRLWGSSRAEIWGPEALGTHLCGSSRAEIWDPSLSLAGDLMVFIGRTDAEAETPVFRPPDGKG